MAGNEIRDDAPAEAAPRRSIVYLCPSSNQPIGGIKVILRHSEILERIGGPGLGSCVLFPQDPDFSVDWFVHSARRKRDLNFDPTMDFVVVPEFWASVFGPQLKAIGVPYAIFVQNGYQLTKGVGFEGLAELRRIYEAAALVLSISEDARRAIGLACPAAVPRIVDVQYSIDGSLFRRGDVKDDIISYMPRKLGHHSDIVVKLLSLVLAEGWRVQPIADMNEAEVARCLRGSRIFLSFSELEGLPVPPLEAALSGNLVVGYTGEGGKEYWSPGLFTEVASGDLNTFVDRVLDATRRIRCMVDDPDSDPAYVANLERLRRRYSPAAEERRLADFANAVREVFGRHR